DVVLFQRAQKTFVQVLAGVVRPEALLLPGDAALRAPPAEDRLAPPPRLQPVRWRRDASMPHQRSGVTLQRLIWRRREVEPQRGQLVAPLDRRLPLVFQAERERIQPP